MRDLDTLFGLEEVTLLLQYLYMSGDHSVRIDNGMTTLDIRMREDCSFAAKNLQFPDLPDMDFTEQMSLPVLLGIIDRLKEAPPREIKKFPSRWQEIRAVTLANVAQNKMNLKKWSGR